MTTFTNERLSHRTLAWIIASAILIRIVWGLLVPVAPLSDSVAYDTFARTLVEHGVYGWTQDKPFAFWPPGTSFLYAAAYSIFGVRYGGIVAVQILLCAGIVFFSARIAERFFGAKIAFVTALIMAFWPTLILYPTVLASELPYMFFSVAGLYFWTVPQWSPWARGAVAGLFLGFAALIRPLALPLPVVIAVAMALYERYSRDALIAQVQMIVVAFIAMGVVIGPWTWRNYQLYGEPVLISTNGGITLWMGNTPGTTGAYMDIPPELSSIRDNEQARILGARAKQYIMDEPGEFVARSFRKLVDMYTNESIGVVWNAEGIKRTFGKAAVVPMKRFTQAAWALLLLSALAGAVALMRVHGWRYIIFSPIVVSIGFYSFVYSVTVAQDRYHLSFAPQIGMLASAGVLAVLEALRKSRRPGLHSEPTT